MPKSTKLIQPSVLIVDNKCGEVFIVEKSERIDSKNLLKNVKVKTEKQNEQNIWISEKEEQTTTAQSDDEEDKCFFEISDLQ